MSLLCSKPLKGLPFHSEWKLEALQCCTNPRSSGISFHLCFHHILFSHCSLPSATLTSLLFSNTQTPTLGPLHLPRTLTLPAKPFPNGSQTQVPQIFTQIMPQGGFSLTTIFKIVAFSPLRTFILSPYFIFSFLHILFIYLFILITFCFYALEYKLWENKDFCLFYSLISLAPRTVPGTYRYSVTILLDKWMSGGN